MAFAIMRFQKYKLSALGKIERHNNERAHLKGRAHPEREGQNITKKAKGYENETLTQIIRKKIKDIKASTGKTTRKDAAVLTEFVLTFSPEKESEILDRGSEWLSANTKWLKDEFESKGAKILRMDVQFDEQTVHIHAFVQMTDERGLFSASRYFGKKKQIEDLQTSYAKYMAPFGLERGKSKSETRARHISLNEYYKSTEGQIKQKIALLQEDAKRIEQEQSRIDAILQSKHNEYESLVNDVFNENDSKDNNYGLNR